METGPVRDYTCVMVSAIRADCGRVRVCRPWFSGRSSRNSSSCFPALWLFVFPQRWLWHSTPAFELVEHPFTHRLHRFPASRFLQRRLSAHPLSNHRWSTHRSSARRLLMHRLPRLGSRWALLRAQSAWLVFALPGIRFADFRRRSSFINLPFFLGDHSGDRAPVGGQPVSSSGLGRSVTQLSRLLLQRIMCRKCTRLR